MIESEHWDMDDPVNIEGLEPEDALRLLLQVDPRVEPDEDADPAK